MTIFCKFPTINIPRLNFLLVICIVKDFIWNTLKAIFSIFFLFKFFALSDFRFSNSCISAKYCPILTNHTAMECILFSFFQMMYKTQFKTKWLVLWSRVTYQHAYYYIAYCTYKAHIVRPYSAYLIPKRITQLCGILDSDWSVTTFWGMLFPDNNW